MSLKTKFKMTTIAVASAMAMGTLAVPTTASAEISYDLALSSMYLWRGQDVSAGNPTVSGSIGYDVGGGFSVGTWVSSEGASGSYELDLYAQYAGKVGDFGYSVGYANYFYPQVAASLTNSDISEYILGVTYADFGFTAYIDTDSTASNGYSYYSFDYSMDKLGFHYGMTNSDISANEYSDFNISYSLTDDLTWTVSKASGNLVDANATMKDPLVVISYNVPLK